MTISTVSSRKEQQPRDTIEVVIDMVRPERIRQSQYPVPRWWLDAAISAFRALRDRMRFLLGLFRSGTKKLASYFVRS